MEILRRGTMPQEVTYDAECRICHTVIRFKAAEAIRTSCQREGDFFTIACPICHKNITRDVH